jgi:hypothetical protein
MNQSDHLPSTSGDLGDWQKLCHTRKRRLSGFGLGFHELSPGKEGDHDCAGI